MRFPQLHQLSIACQLTAIRPGRLHADGRRYLPLIVLGFAVPPPMLADVASLTPAGLLLGVVDRHHVVDQERVGAWGVARLVCALSLLRVQTPPYRIGIAPEAGWQAGQPSTTPTLFGRVVQVIAWEAEQARLAYEALYTELLIDTGQGVVGLRTSTTAASLEAQIGKAQIEQGDWVELHRSRIDILGFEAG